MSNNIFQQVLNDAQGVEEQLLGPTYPYYKNIKTPSQIGMSDRGTIQQMGQNIVGLTNYVSLLVSGSRPPLEMPEYARIISTKNTNLVVCIVRVVSPIFLVMKKYELPDMPKLQSGLKTLSELHRLLFLITHTGAVCKTVSR